MSVVTGCPYYWVEFRENVKAFFRQGQRKLSVIKSLGVRVKRGLTVLTPLNYGQSYCLQRYASEIIQFLPL